MNRRYRKTIIAGNWKMNKTATEAKKFADDFKALLPKTKWCDVVVCVPSVDISAAVRAMGSKKYKDAFECFQQAAELGCPRGYWGMAFLYDQGKYGVKRDKKKAEEMHRKAGAAGYAPSASRFGAAWPDAARVLGLTAAEAREQSRTRRRAAAEGYASEQYNLGVMYQTGFGLPKDMAKAREWFQKAADQGDVQAKSILKKLR